VIIGHAALTDWGLTHVTVNPADACLDVGCGGGRTVQKLAAIAVAGRVCGIDYSEATRPRITAHQRRHHRCGPRDDRARIRRRAPYPDRTFDVVTAVETHYYWPDLEANQREVLRVLKPGGTLALIAETVRDRQKNPLYFVVMPLLGAAHLTTAEHEQVLTRAVFADAAVDSRASGWMCATGRRPTA
jgi:SAM-dependent methyltransferase